MDYEKLEDEIGKWAGHNFDFHAPQLGCAEEIGELVHAILKKHQGIRQTDDHREVIKDCLADAMIFLSHLKFVAKTSGPLHDGASDEFMLLAKLLMYASKLIDSPRDPHRHMLFQEALEETAGHFNFNLLEITNETWADVSKRDWRKFPKNGLTD